MVLVLPWPWCLVREGRCARARRSAPRPATQAAVAASALAVFVALSALAPVAQAEGRCAGETWVDPVGATQIVAARWNTATDQAGKVSIDRGVVEVGMKGRVYFAERCASCQSDTEVNIARKLGTCSGEDAWRYDNTEYSALKLLGKAFRYSVDLGPAVCGTNAALYLTSLRQNTDSSTCGDYYCDAASVCGVSCAEIDLQEANKHVWRTTLHTATDPWGKTSGVGQPGGWTVRDYGPGARCIDTTMPFQVEAAFPLDGMGNLVGVRVTLTQASSPCSLSTMVDNYSPKGTDGLRQLEVALRAGMTPIISFWGDGADLTWLDGKQCPHGGRASMDSDPVRFYDFSVGPIDGVTKRLPSEGEAVPVPSLRSQRSPSAAETIALPTPTRAAAEQQPAPAPAPAPSPALPTPTPAAAEQQPAPAPAPAPSPALPTPTPVAAEQQPAPAPAPAPSPAPPPPASHYEEPGSLRNAPAPSDSTSTHTLSPVGVVALLGLLVMVAVTCLQERMTRGAKKRAGDTVVVRRAFVGKGSESSSANLQVGTKGTVVSVEEDTGEAVILFAGFKGNFTVPVAQQHDLEFQQDPGTE